MSQATQAENALEQLINLTDMALEAARLGKWESVAEVYDRRARIGALDSIPREVAMKLMQYDQWIMTRIREVQSLVQHQLREAEQHRRSLEGLKRQWVTTQPAQAQHRLSI